MPPPPLPQRGRRANLTQIHLLCDRQPGDAPPHHGPQPTDREWPAAGRLPRAGPGWLRFGPKRWKAFHRQPARRDRYGGRENRHKRGGPQDFQVLAARLEKAVRRLAWPRPWLPIARPREQDPEPHSVPALSPTTSTPRPALASRELMRAASPRLLRNPIRSTRVS